MKLISWNVNGIRAVLKKGFTEFLERENPDIICLQETKAHEAQVNYKLKTYEQYWNDAERRGYAGTAVFTKISPLSMYKGMSKEEHNKEGRILTLEFKNFYLVNVYTPNAQPELKRLKYRQEWDKDFLDYLKKLEKTKPVIVCGDFNVAHKEIDLARPKDNLKNPGFTEEEREGFSRYIEHGFTDAFRYFYPNKKDQYTWWSVRTNARERNVGWRIDYFCISKELQSKLKEAKILSHVKGSDHCPVEITLKD